MARLIWLATLLVATMAPATAAAAAPTCTKSYAGSGNWSTAASWSGGTLPVSGDVVCWGSGSTLTVDASIAAPVVFGAGSGTLAFAGAGSVTASNSAPSQGPIAGVQMGSGSLYVGAGVTLSVIDLTMTGTQLARGMISGSTNATVDVSGTVSINGGLLYFMTLTQSGASAGGGDGGFHVPVGGGSAGAPELYASSVTTNRPVTIANPSFLAYNSTIVTTSTSTLASGYDNTASGSYNAWLSTDGLVTAGATSILDGVALELTGASSNVAGAVHLGGLGSSASGSLSLASGAAITVDSAGMGSPTWAGSLSGVAANNAGAVTIEQGNTTFTGTVSGVDLTLTTNGGLLPTVTATPATTTSFHPHSLKVNAGSFYVTLGDTVNADALTMQGADTSKRGLIHGGGTADGGATTINVSGPIQILGGEVQGIIVHQTGGAPFTLPAGVTAGTGAGAPYFWGAVVTSDGPISVGNPAVDFYSSSVTTTSTTAFAPAYDGSVSGSDFSHLSAAGFQSIGSADLAGVTEPATVDFTATGGTTTLRSGTVASGNWYIEPGATLVAIGGIGGRLTNQGGIVQIGARGSATPAAVTFANGYAQTSGTLRVDVPGAASVDRILQTGGPATTITGGTIDADFTMSYRPDATFDGVPVDGSGAAGGTATVTAVTVTSAQLAGRRHLVADNKGLGGVGSSSLHLTYPTVLPAVPTLTGTPGDRQASVTIGASTDDGGSPILHYTVSCAPDCGPSAPGATGVVTTFTIAPASAGHAIVLSGLANAQPYTYHVVAENANGMTGPSQPLELTPSHLPVGSLILLPTSLVATSASAKFTATCGTDVSAPLASCSVVAKSGGTVIAGPATVSRGGAAIPVTLKVTAKGIKAAAVAGGVVATVTATITLADHRVLKAVAQIVITKKKAKKIVISSSILFASGSATIGAAGKRFLAQKAKLWLKGAKSVTCTGYTDSDGDAAANYTLGLNRAKAVCAELKKTMGTKVKYLVGSGGETHPVASNNTNAGKAANRRVELAVS